MEKREVAKIVHLQGREFKVEKFTAEVGSFILFTLMEKFLPMALEEKAGLDALPKNRQSMDRAEFWSFQRDCLSVVSEKLPAGYTPIIGENGRFAVDGLERNTRLVMLLTINALTFNLADFFDAEGLKELKASLAGIFPASIRTLMPTFTPRS